MKSQKIRSTVSPLQSAYPTGAGCMASNESESKPSTAQVFVDKIAQNKQNIDTNMDTHWHTHTNAQANEHLSNHLFTQPPQIYVWSL